MISVRTYSPERGDAGALAAAGGLTATLGQNIERWCKAGLTCPELCFVFGGESLFGGAALASFEAHELDFLDFAPGSAQTADGAALIKLCVRLALRPGDKTVSYHLYNDNDQYDSTRAMFFAAGFSAAQEKKSYVKQGAPHPVPPAPLLTFRDIDAVGEDVFLDAVERVTVGTLDRADAGQARELGAPEAAKAYMDCLRRIDFRPGWWRLGYDGSEPVGLIVPQKLGDSLGGINYIGVFPEKRGRGYVHGLLHEGTRLLMEEGFEKIMADIDVENTPMENALLRAGYVFECEETVLALSAAEFMKSAERCGEEAVPFLLRNHSKISNT